VADHDPTTGSAGDGDPARAQLADVRDQLTGQLAELDEGEDELAFDENFADSGQVAAEQGENRLLANQLREQLGDVERALAKLDDGTYGTCEVCGGRIGEARLEVMPATRFCIDHAG
jgi:RNA polymerase-binding transcription factor DksA